MPLRRRRRKSSPKRSVKRGMIKLDLTKFDKSSQTQYESTFRKRFQRYVSAQPRRALVGFYMGLGVRRSSRYPKGRKFTTAMAVEGGAKIPDRAWNEIETIFKENTIREIYYGREK
jgi:hypothetical protein